MNPIFEAMRVVTDFFMIYLKSIKQTNRPGMVWRTEDYAMVEIDFVMQFWCYMTR